MNPDSLIVPPVNCLVWVRWNGRVLPEKWPRDVISGIKDHKVVLAFHELGPDEFAMKIAILEQRYPAPKIEEA